MRKLARVLGIVGAVGAATMMLAGCAGAGSPETNGTGITVVTTTTQLDDFVAQVAGDGGGRVGCRRRLAIECQLQPEGKAFGRVLQFAHIARPVMAQQQGPLRRLQRVRPQAMALAGRIGETGCLGQWQIVIAQEAPQKPWRDGQVDVLRHGPGPQQ